MLNTVDRINVLRDRTKHFAIRIVKMFKALPHTAEAQIIGKQVLRSGTAVAANYRAACRSRSRMEFVSKMAVVVEEADETVFWLELLVESGIVPARKMRDLLDEANQLLAIFASAHRTSRSRNRREPIR